MMNTRFLGNFSLFIWVTAIAWSPAQANKNTNYLKCYKSLAGTSGGTQVWVEGDVAASYTGKEITQGSEFIVATQEGVRKLTFKDSRDMGKVSYITLFPAGQATGMVEHVFESGNKAFVMYFSRYQDPIDKKKWIPTILKSDTWKDPLKKCKKPTCRVFLKNKMTFISANDDAIKDLKNKIRKLTKTIRSKKKRANRSSAGPVISKCSKINELKKTLRRLKKIL